MCNMFLKYFKHLWCSNQITIEISLHTIHGEPKKNVLYGFAILKHQTTQYMEIINTQPHLHLVVYLCANVCIFLLDMILVHTKGFCGKFGPKFATILKKKCKIPVFLQWVPTWCVWPKREKNLNFLEFHICYIVKFG